MNYEQILALLLTQHVGARKDVMANIARNIAMVAESEEDAQKLIKAITDDKVNAFTKDYRSSIDREVTEATQTKEARLREKYNFVDKKQNPDPSTPPKGDPGTDGGSQNPEIAALTKQIAALTGIVTGMATERTASTRKAQVEEVLKDVKDQSYKDAILNNFGYMSFDDDQKFDEWKNQLSTAVAAKVQQQADDGLRNTCKVNFGKTGTDGISEGVAAYIKEKAGNDGANLEGKSLN